MLNFKKIRDLISEADAAEYKGKKDSEDEVKDIKPRSKGEEDFVKLHKIEVKTEDEYEEIHEPEDVETKKRAELKNASSNKDRPKDASPDMTFKKFMKMGGHGQSSYRSADRQDGDKAVKKVSDGATKVVESLQEDLRTDAQNGIGLFSKSEAEKHMSKKQDLDYYKPDGDKAYGVISNVTRNGYTVTDLNTKKKYKYTFAKTSNADAVATAKAKFKKGMKKEDLNEAAKSFKLPAKYASVGGRKGSAYKPGEADAEAKLADDIAKKFKVKRGLDWVYKKGKIVFPRGKVPEGLADYLKSLNESAVSKASDEDLMKLLDKYEKDPSKKKEYNAIKKELEKR